MEVFRLSRSAFARSLSGKGAALQGAWWNSVGIELIYTAGNRSLAMAEVAVHLTLATLPSDYLMNTIYIPDNLVIKVFDPKALSKGWNLFPHSPFTQSLGDRFVLEGKHCVMRVPSAVTRGDFNFLINPNHSDFRRIKIIDSERFPWDERMLG